MRARLTALVVLVFAMGLLVPGVASANGDWIIDDEDDVTLDNDYSGSILILADGVTFDCDGHQVTGGGIDEQGIRIYADNVTVRNCSISGFGLSGVFTFETVGLTLDGNTVFDNGADGFGLYESSGITAINNDVYENGQSGFKIRSSTNSTFVANEAWSNGINGFFLSESDGNLITENVATHNSENGLSLWESASNTISLNLLSTNGIDGMYINGDKSDGNRVFENTAEHNSGAGFSVDFGDGTVLEANRANENGIFGILLGQTEDSLVSRNSAAGNGSIDYIIVESRGTEIVANTAVSSGTGFLISDSVGVVVHDNAASGGWAGFTLNAVLDCEVTHNRSTDAGVGYRLEASDGNLFKSNLAAGFEYRGYEVTGSHLNRLLENEAVNDDSSNGGGFLLGEGSSFNELMANSSFGGDDFILNSAPNNTLKGNTATGNLERPNNDGTDGFLLIESDHNVVIENTSIDAGSAAYRIDWSAGNELKGNTAVGAGEYGIELAGARQTVIAGNSVDGFHVGVRLWNSEDNTIRDTTSRDPASIGFELVDSRRNTLNGNTSWYPGDHGFSLWYSEDNTLKGNTAHSLESHGFVLVASDGNEFAGNTGVSQGGLAGFHILGSSHGQFTENRLTGYAFGFTIESGPWVEVYLGSDHNVFSENEVSESEILGFYLGKSEANVLSRNLVQSNHFGVGVGDEAIGNRYLENRIRENDIGYVNWGGSANLVKENFFCQNAVDIDDPDDPQTSFIDNKLCGPKS